MINTNRLIELLVDKNLNISDVATCIRRSHNNTVSKLRNRTPMSLREAEKIQYLLGIEDEDFSFYFLNTWCSE